MLALCLMLSETHYAQNYAGITGLVLDVIHWSRVVHFANDTKCFRHIKSADDEQSIQNDLNNLASWNATSHLSFNPSITIPIYHLIMITICSHFSTIAEIHKLVCEF